MVPAVVATFRLQETHSLQQYFVGLFSLPECWPTFRDESRIYFELLLLASEKC